VILSVYRNDELLNAQTLDIPSEGQIPVSLKDLPGGDAIFKARLEPTGGQEERLDALPLDDTAFAIYQGGKNRRILIFSKGNFFLEQVLSALPGVSAYRALPAPGTPEGESGNFQLLEVGSGDENTFDLYVLDGVLPTAPASNIPELPKGNLLLVNPPTTALFNVTGTFTETSDIQVAEHTLTQFLDWSEVHIAKAHFVQDTWQRRWERRNPGFG
jgi:hypothetical protein